MIYTCIWRCDSVPVHDPAPFSQQFFIDVGNMEGTNAPPLRGAYWDFPGGAGSPTGPSLGSGGPHGPSLREA